jgi:hypothetical protein
MLEAFLRQAEPPNIGVPTDRYDWPATLIVFSLFAFTDGPDWTFFAGIAAGAVVLYSLRAFRASKLRLVKPIQRIEYDRWLKVKRLKKLLKDWGLSKRTPAPVLLALEQAARTWQEARDSLTRLIDSDPDFAAEIIQTVDAKMVTAVAAAEPVVLHDEQVRRDLSKIESDEDLMTRVCLGIQQQEAFMAQWAKTFDANHLAGAGPLRDRLEAARRERAQAEAELDTLI